MGCSNPHPHGQLWATNYLPNEPLKKYINQKVLLSFCVSLFTKMVVHCLVWQLLIASIKQVAKFLEVCGSNKECPVNGLCKTGSFKEGEDRV